MPVSISQFINSARVNGLSRLLTAARLVRRALGFAPPEVPPAWPVFDKAPPVWTPPADLTSFQAPPSYAPLVDLPLPEVQPGAAAPYAIAPADLKTVPRPVPSLPEPASPARPASFTPHVFEFAGEEYAYRLYHPSTGAAALAPVLPLLVLLHGCKQDAADFAQGTAMNRLAEQRQCLVLYPEQLDKANRLRCWNWFEPAHQSRGAGEPAMLAALTRHVLASQRADPARVYVAGLSAGGAMAALVAGLYPELFSAVGVHSGLPSGAASGMLSALSAMRRGSGRTGVTTGAEGVMPTIVFHGSADKTVHPDNGDQVVAAALAGWQASGLALEKSQRSEVGAADVASATPQRQSVRDIYTGADGKPYVEHWTVAAGPHAWSGGDSAGSFTDPLGPSASAAMLDFFLRHHK